VTATGPPDAAPAAGRVRPGTRHDAAAAARLHATQISEGFLASLGPRFLVHLYGRIARDPSSFLLVADGAAQSEPVAGFIAGAVDVRALYRSFLRHDGPTAAASALAGLVRSWRTALETLRHGTDGPDGPELLAVAVDPAWRGGGVGARLVAAFQTEIQRRGLGEASVVVGAANEPAQALYRSAGFAARRAVEVHPGVPSLLMTWTVPSGREPGPPSGRSDPVRP
jgi:ribosomal protein S18 acetylase RimI-like enzyme